MRILSLGVTDLNFNKINKDNFRYNKLFNLPMKGMILGSTEFYYKLNNKTYFTCDLKESKFYDSNKYPEFKHGLL